MKQLELQFGNGVRKLPEKIVDNVGWSGKYADFTIKQKKISTREIENLSWYENWKKENFNSD